MKNSSLLTLRAIGLVALLGCLSAVCAAPVYTPAVGANFFLLRDGNTNTFAIDIKAPSGLDVTVPAGLVGYFPQVDADTFSVTNLGVTEAVTVDIAFGTVLDGPGVLNVLGLGSPQGPLTDPLLIALGSPLLFTFDLIQFDQAAGTAIYSLRNFEAIQTGGEVPEPATVALMGGGLGLLALLRRRR